MRYEPVGYIMEYEISALLFLLVIMMRYFSARRFPNQKNSMFSFILWATVADIILDVFSSLIIDNVFLFPLPVIYIVNTSFYFISIFMLLLMMIYTIVLIEHLSLKRLKRLISLFLPGLAVVFMLIINPYSHWLFYVDQSLGYIHGKMFISIYIACFFYLAVTFIIVMKNKEKLRHVEYSTIIRFLIIVLISAIIQYAYPVLLITGVAITLAVIMMYFTIQNPDTMVDTTTGAFTYDAMLTFLRDRMLEGDMVQLVAVKIHNMPRINDLLGIENGSQLLQKVCIFLKEGSRDSWVFRMRGSSFVAITRRNEDFRNLSESFIDRVGKHWTINNIEILLQYTVCCVATDELTDTPISPQEAISYLDTAFAMSERSSGEITSIIEGAELLSRIKRNQEVEAALRDAIKNDEGLELYFQPLWSVKHERFVSAEVLLRFTHSKLGSVPPDEFVPIAESSGFVTAMDELVMRKACAFIHDSQQCRGLGLETLEINLSALEFMHSRLPELLNDIMSEYNVDPSFLCFEITETAATESFDLLLECMTKLCKIGCQFALDDFGTGYANISQVIQLPFSTVKLDKSLLKGPNVVLEDMVRMFTRLNRSTVIEGVESENQVSLMKAINVDYIQGYYYARPMSQHDFIKFLQMHINKKTSDIIAAAQ